VRTTRLPLLGGTQLQPFDSQRTRRLLAAYRGAVSTVEFTSPARPWFPLLQHGVHAIAATSRCALRQTATQVRCPPIV